MYFRTNNLPQESGINIPLGLGVSLDVSERIRFDIGMNYHLSFADIDHAPGLSNNDNFTVVNFTLHYDLFTQKPDEYNDYDESNYRKINFKAIEVEDNDGDGIADIIDNNDEEPANHDMLYAEIDLEDVLSNEKKQAEQMLQIFLQTGVTKSDAIEKILSVEPFIRHKQELSEYLKK